MIARYLLDNGANIEARDKVRFEGIARSQYYALAIYLCDWLHAQYGRTPLMMASKLGLVKLICLLLDRGADVQSQDDVSA